MTRMAAIPNELFRPHGGWLATPIDSSPALDGDRRADVAVVGAGYAGLSTALELKARGVDVVVLEREHAGFGASGRNAGYLAGGQGLEYEFFLNRVGHERAKAIVGFYDEGVRYVERKLAQYAIDCDYTASGLIRAGIHPSQEKPLRKSMETGCELGSPAEFLSSEQLRTRGIPPAFLFGAFVPRGGTLDPGKYVQGLRRAAIEAGVALYEHTPVTALDRGATLTVRTPRGNVTASSVVLATNAYTQALGELTDAMFPIQVSAIETQPLSTEQRTSLGWPNREGIVTPHYSMESHRLTARNSLVVTTKRLGYRYGGATPNEPDRTAYRALLAALHSRFPTLRDIGIGACWSGWITFAADALPIVGNSERHANVYCTAGCSGHGVGTQSLVGRLLAARICGESDSMLDALDHRPPKLPPEPFRWALFQGLMRSADLLDRLTDVRAARHA
jgi:glycine/D-amino acid oxidase-like deaminating enzyme